MSVMETITYAMPPSPQDPFVGPSSSRNPRSYFTHNLPSPPPSSSSSSFSQSRTIKTGRPYAPTSSPDATARTKFALPSPTAFVGTSSGDYAYPLGCAPLTPSGSPQSPSTLMIHPSLLSPSLDVEMTDAYATPPTTRIVSTTSNLRGTPMPISPPPSTTKGRLLKKNSAPYPSVLAPITVKNGLTLNAPIAPLTPPLTPPYSQASLPSTPPPAISLSSVLNPAPTTISGRLLANYVLHPLFADQYTISDELGSGGFGFVVRANRHADGLGVAVKFIERVKIPEHGWVSTTSFGDLQGLAPVNESGRRRVPMEAYVLRGVKSEGVVGFIDLFEDEKYFYLVMEHHGTPWSSPSSSIPSSSSAGPTSVPLTLSTSLPIPSSLSPPRPVPMMRRSSCDLFECIEQHSRFDEYTAKYVFAQIVETVWELGRMGICHRDIKDENIVVSKDFRVKLIDFGSAVIFDPTKPAPFYNRFYGTTSFASSEILRGEPYQAPSSEVWSLGVLLSILVTGECPFTDPAAAAQGKRSKPRVRLGIEVEWLLRKCLEVDVSKRITVREIRECAWLRGVMRRK